MGKYKDKHGNTLLHDFLKKVSKVVPVGEALVKASAGNFSGALQSIGEVLGKHAKTNEEAKKLLDEFEIRKIELDNEVFQLESKDRDSARNREIEMAKTGKTDWLMYAAGVTALAAFGVMVYSILFREMPESALLHQLIGMIEGVAMTIFAYYFGASKKME